MLASPANERDPVQALRSRHQLNCFLFSIKRSVPWFTAKLVVFYDSIAATSLFVITSVTDLGTT